MDNNNTYMVVVAHSYIGMYIRNYSIVNRRGNWEMEMILGPIIGIVYIALIVYTLYDMETLDEDDPRF